jgi:hypothetical protein
MSKGNCYVNLHMNDVLSEFDFMDVLHWYKKDMGDAAFTDILKDFVAKEEEK